MGGFLFEFSHTHTYHSMYPYVCMDVQNLYVGLM